MEYAYLLDVDTRALQDLQERLNEQGLRINARSSPLHCTLFVGASEATEIANLPTSADSLTLRAIGVATFETPDGYAIHVQIEKTAELVALQKQVHAAFVATDATFKEWYAPDNWQPHITLFYAEDAYQETLEPFDIGVLGVTLNSNAEQPTTPQRNADKRIALGTTVKALVPDGSRIGGYLVVFADESRRDLHGEYFAADTEYYLDLYTERPALYHHGLDATVKMKPMGIIDTIKADKVGLWAEAQMLMHNEYIEDVLDLVSKGVLNWSSGAFPQSVQVDASGKITHWALAEGSLTPTPAFPPRIYAGADTQITTLKAMHVTPLKDLLGKVAPRSLPTEPHSKNVHFKGLKAMDKETLSAVLDALLNAMPTAPQLSADERAALLDAVLAQMTTTDMEAVAASDPVAAGEAMAAAVTKALNAHVTKSAALAAAKASAHTAANAGQSKVPPYRGTELRVASPFDKLSAMDMAYWASVRGKEKQPLSQGYWRAFASKAEQAHNTGTVTLNAAGMKAVQGIKSDELDYSTQAGYGDEWVPDLWSSTLWDRMRLENKIASSLQVVDMPSNPYEIPVETTDPTVYFVPETTAEAELTLAASGNPTPDSKLATAKAQLAAKKLSLRVGVSAELEEDSIIPFIAQLRKQAERALLDAVDNVVLNGDTVNTATGNINLDDADPPDTAKYLAFNGLRKLALVTNTALKVDGSGAAPTLSAIRSARFKMLNAYAADPEGLRLVTDAMTYAKLLSLPEFITMDKAGSLATAQTGVLGFLDGMPVIVSNEMGLTEADGKISTTGSNNTLGQICMYHVHAWYMGYRRRIRVDSVYLPYYDSYQLVATVRVALINRDTSASAVLYNLAV